MLFQVLWDPLEETCPLPLRPHLTGTPSSQLLPSLPTPYSFIESQTPERQVTPLSHTGSTQQSWVLTKQCWLQSYPIPCFL